MKLGGLFLQGANIWEPPVASGAAQFVNVDGGWQVDPVGKEEALPSAALQGALKQGPGVQKIIPKGWASLPRS